MKIKDHTRLGLSLDMTVLLSESAVLTVLEYASRELVNKPLR